MTTTQEKINRASRNHTELKISLCQLVRVIQNTPQGPLDEYLASVIDGFMHDNGFAKDLGAKPIDLANLDSAEAALERLGLALDASPTLPARTWGRIIEKLGPGLGERILMQVTTELNNRLTEARKKDTPMDPKTVFESQKPENASDTVIRGVKVVPGSMGFDKDQNLTADLVLPEGCHLPYEPTEALKPIQDAGMDLNISGEFIDKYYSALCSRIDAVLERLPSLPLDRMEAEARETWKKFDEMPTEWVKQSAEIANSNRLIPEVNADGKPTDRFTIVTPGSAPVSEDPVTQEDPALGPWESMKKEIVERMRKLNAGREFRDEETKKLVESGFISFEDDSREGLDDDEEPMSPIYVDSEGLRSRIITDADGVHIIQQQPVSKRWVAINSLGEVEAATPAAVEQPKPTADTLNPPATDTVSAEDVLECLTNNKTLTEHDINALADNITSDSVLDFLTDYHRLTTVDARLAAILRGVILHIQDRPF